MKTSMVFAALLTLSVPAFAQSLDKTAVQFVSDKVVPLYLVEEHTLPADDGKTLYELMDDKGFKPLTKISKLTLLGYTPLATSFVPGNYKIQVGSGEGSSTLAFDINVKDKPQVWKLTSRNDVLGNVVSGVTLASLIGTVVCFQPAVSEWKDGHFKTNSIVVSASALGLILSLGLMPTAAPTAKQQE